MKNGAKQVRVLIVSDSPYTRYVLSGTLSPEPDLFVVGSVHTPRDIGTRVAMLRPDVLVVDLDCFEDVPTLQRAIFRLELPVLALCPRNGEGAAKALAVVEAGFSEVVIKSDGGAAGITFAPNLIERLHAVAQTHPHPTPRRWPGEPAQAKAVPRLFVPGDPIIVATASALELHTLAEFLVALPASLAASVFVLISLPEFLLRAWLRRLAPFATFKLRLARDGLHLQSGVALFAPFDCHICVGPRGLLVVDYVDPFDGGIGPLDATMSSLAAQYGPAVTGVSFSRRGRDGVQGALDIAAAGGRILVWGTPTGGVADPLHCIVEESAVRTVLSPAAMVREIQRYRVGA
jgi:two-component system chemotaxis response regulator CheB